MSDKWSKKDNEILKRVQENDPTLTELIIGRGGGIFEGANDSEFANVGSAIIENTHIRKLSICTDGLNGNPNLLCLRRNSSIRELYLRCNDYNIGRVGNELLKIYRGKNKLTILRINAQNSNKGYQSIIHTLKKCTNLKVIDLSHSDINDEHLLQIVRTLRGNHVIEEVNLSNMRLHGNGSRREIATLLKDPDCNLHTLNLEYNFISKEGLRAIANGLTDNAKLKRLYVDRNAIDQDVRATFSRLSFKIIYGMGQVVFSRISSGSSSMRVSNECGNCKKTNNLTTICNKCKSVKYCNGSCMKAHWKKHEKDCLKFIQQKKIDVTLHEKEIELAKKAWAKGLQQRKEDEEKRASKLSKEVDKEKQKRTAGNTNRAAPQSKKESVDKNYYNSKMILFQQQGEAWQRVSKFVLGEELTAYCTPEGIYIRDMLQTLLNTIKSGCCSNVGPGYMCGRCESSVDVIRISRAIILSICKLPIELNDDITRKELDRIRSWVCNQIKEFKDDSGDDNEIIAVLPQKLRGLVVRLKHTDCFDLRPPWGEDDFGILMQQPSPTWIIRINVLMLMGYKVELVNFNDVARFSRKDLTVVHDGTHGSCAI